MQWIKGYTRSRFQQYVITTVQWTGTPAARGLPEARLMKSGTSTSLTAVALERSITRVLRRVVSAGRSTGRSLPPCDEPSTQGCGSSVVLTLEHRRIPETAGQSVVPHVLVFNPDGIVFIFECCITCVNLLFPNSRCRSIFRCKVVGPAH